MASKQISCYSSRNTKWQGQGHHLGPGVYILMLSVLSFGASIVSLGVISRQLPTTAACVEIIFPFSAAKESIEYRWVNFHDQYVPRSIYRGPPTAERETMWDALSPFGVIDVSTQSLSTSPIVLERDLDPWSGHSKNRILAVPGVILHMNCLRLIRQYVYRETNQTLFAPPSRDLVDQCIEIIREELLCDCDTTPYLIADDPGAARGFVPVIGNTHYCRDYDKIMDWTTQSFISAVENRSSFFIS